MNKETKKSSLTPQASFLLRNLTYLADSRERICRPNRKSLGMTMNCGPIQISDSMKELTTKGYIKRHSKKTRNVYVILMSDEILR